jgi:Carboxypeptidase regulatory-like domain/TonB dependent receptor
MRGYFTLFLLIATAVMAQTSAQMTGGVTDPSGAAVASAVVDLVQVGTGKSIRTMTNANGIYLFPFEAPGGYTLTVAKPGFQSATRSGIELQVQETARLDIELSIGVTQDSVTVGAAAPLLSTENATAGTVIDNQRIVRLPLNGRNYLQLISLSPNTTAGFGSSGFAVSRQGGSRSTQTFAVAGQRSEFNHFTLDGAENTDVNFNTYALLPSVDALQEFKVQTGIYPAEFGREAAQINVSIKSGSNDFHGSAFEFLRNDKLDATPYAFTALRPQKDPFHWNQYGFTLGGPVWIPRVYKGRNRLFFLSNFEGYRDRKHIQGTYNVPTAAMRAGDFPAIPARIYDPASRAQSGNSISATPFPGNVIPRNRISQTSVALMEFLPEPNTNPGALSSNLLEAALRRVDKDQFHQRMDLVESQKSSWFGRYSWSADLEIGPPTPNANGQPVIPHENGLKLATDVAQAVVSNTRLLRPAVVSDARLSYSRFRNNLGGELAGVRDVVKELGIPGIPLLSGDSWGAPGISVTGFSGFAGPGDGPYVTNDRVWDWGETLSWSHGRHALRLGAQGRRDAYDQDGNQFLRGGFGFLGVVTQNPAGRAGTGYPLADYLLGYPYQSNASVAIATARSRSTSYAGFVDDTWRLRRSLSISLGLRYENTPPWLDKSGTAINAAVPFADITPNVNDPARHPVLVRAGAGDFYEGSAIRFDPAIQIARDGRLGDRMVARDSNDFAPRAGIAWTPSSRWTVRAGAGMFYSQDAANPRFDMTRNLAGRRGDVTDADFPDLTWAGPFHGLGAPVLSRPFVLANTYDRRTPYSIQYLFNVQRELSSNTVIEAGYMGSASRKLEMLRFLNQPVPGTTPVVTRTPYPELGLIQEVDGSGTAAYNSFFAKAERRFSRGLTYLASYTWSRSIDDASAIRFHDGDMQFPQNSNCIRCERGLSGFNIAHRFVMSALYDLPMRRRAVWGGWQLGSILTAQTGFPFTVTTGGDTASIGNGVSRPNATGADPTLPASQRSTEQYFNTTAFVLQAPGSFGNLGRNNLIGPGLVTLDGSAIKEFSIREGRSVQLRFEAFNALNHPNWGLPGASMSAADFGKIRQTRTLMREIQIAAKFVF